MRVCLNLAIIEMVNQTKTIETHYDPDACPTDYVVPVNGVNKTASFRPVSYPKFDS